MSVRQGKVLAGLALCALALGLFLRSFSVTRYGLFSRNNCGTFDRYIVWERSGAWFMIGMPNGFLGRDADACKQGALL